MERGRLMGRSERKETGVWSQNENGVGWHSRDRSMTVAAPLLVLIVTLLSVGCTSTTSTTSSKEVGLSRKLTSEAWGKTTGGEAVSLYTLTNAKGTEARIATYGGIVVSLKVPDKSGQMGDIVLGFDSLDGYLQQPPPPYFGALIGRYGNRIAKGKFTLNGVEYTLAKNNGENHLHGGVRGFDKRVWTAKEGAGQSLELSYLSKDGE
jgi:aldose 1-epimerase